MNKKRILLVSGVALVVLLLAGVIGVTAVSAQESPPGPGIPFAHRMGRGMGGFGGRGFFGMGGGGRWTMFDTAAEALGLTPEELFAELHGGKTLEEIAEEQGIEMDVLQEAMGTARVDAMRQAIEQAVEDENMTQEQADWLLEGLEKGFFPRGRGLGLGRGWGGFGCPQGE
jgi:uncharacterized membrane protein